MRHVEDSKSANIEKYLYLKNGMEFFIYVYQHFFAWYVLSININHVNIE